MDLSVARDRLSCVVKPDSITASQGDFLATHVAINRLLLLNKFEFAPTTGENYSEEDVFQKYILNPENRHQLITVYGQSGTGKSHLIRWFKARFDQEKPDNEVVLFIRRSDNTLKGTIRQLLAQPEVQDIANKDVYERLSRATVSVDENKLKDMIYHNFIIEVRNDDGGHAIRMPNVKRKRLEAFMSNDIIHDYLMSEDGPIERMYSKVAEHTMVDRDTVAQFNAEDFIVSSDLYDEMTRSGADDKAKRLALELMSDEEGPEKAKFIAEYLNQFVNDVIQRCAGIEPGDFRQIFQDIRKELFRLGKNLTLFVEDVTSFTGVDEALLEALLVDHNGMNAADQICRISSILGTTNNYLQNNFLDNHKARVTKYVYIPDDAFDEDELFEFVARYVNAMSLSEQTIEEWVKNHAAAADYPVHAVKEGKNWEFVTLDSGKKLCLYPFTKNSIRYFYRFNLTNGQRTPRYVIRDIIEPVVNDILNHPETFPSVKYQIMNVNTTLNYRVHAQIQDAEQADRVLRFLSIWGDGSADQYTEDGVAYRAGIRQDILEELKIPVVDLTTVEAPQKAEHLVVGVPSAEKTAPKPAEQNLKNEYAAISDRSQEKVSKANTVLTQWVNGAPLDISAKVGIIGTLNAAHEDMCEFLLSAINWQAEGVSMDNIGKIKATKGRLLGFENQTKNRGVGLYQIPATWESLTIVMAFVRWREYGNKSWDYPDADLDAYLVTLWCARIKDDLVKAVKPQETKDRPCYIDAAIAAEIYRMILCGGLKDQTFKGMSYKHLFAKKTACPAGSNHCQRWKELAASLSAKGNDDINRDTIRQYFNIVQGDGSGTMVVLDEMALAQAFHRVKRSGLEFPQTALESQDEFRKRREVFEYLKGIKDRIDTVAQEELTKARTVMQEIYELFGEDEIAEDDIEELVVKANKFFNTVNNVQINIATVETDQVKRSAKKIAKAMQTIEKVLDSHDTLKILEAFSGDPIATLIPLKEFLDKMDGAIEKVEKTIELRKEKLGDDLEEAFLQDRYAQALQSLSADADIISEMR